MRHRGHRDEVRRRALRAVTRISFTIGIAGCADDVPRLRPEVDDGRADAVVDAAVDDLLAPDGAAPDFGRPDALAADAGWPDAVVEDAGWPDAFVEDAGEPDAFAEDGGLAAADAGESDMFVADAGSPCPSPEEDAEAWSKCCDELGWPIDVPVCVAWGPPMPPAMEVA